MGRNYFVKETGRDGAVSIYGLAEDEDGFDMKYEAEQFVEWCKGVDDKVGVVYHYEIMKNEK